MNKYIIIIFLVFLSWSKLQAQEIIPNFMCISIATMLEKDNLGVLVNLDTIGNAQLIIGDTRLFQKWFEQGLNLLLVFWHFEAFKSFKEIVKNR